MFGFLPKSGKEGAATKALPKKSRLDDAFVRYPSPRGPTVLSSNANIQRFIVKKLGPNYYNVQANDNEDNDWHDLDLNIQGDGTVKFTIENSGGCDGSSSFE